MLGSPEHDTPEVDAGPTLVRRAGTVPGRGPTTACSMMTAVNAEILINVWQRILVNPRASWVLFAHGTCVVLTAPGTDLPQQATEILREFGPVHAGSSAGDFSVINLKGSEGWAVTGHHPDVLTYVAPDELGDHSTVAVGLHGRSKRHRDGTELRIIHVQDRRDDAPPARSAEA